MAIFVAFVVFIASSGAFACDTRAPLPKLEQPLDWWKYNGTWYETITTFNPIAMNVACLIAYDIPSVMSKRGGAATVTYNNDLRKKMRWRLDDAKNGYFHHVDITADEITAVDFDENGNFNLESAIEEEEMKHELITYLGDYQRYLAHIRCTPEGWVVAIFTNVKTVSPELFLHIRNDLLDHGVAAPLRLSRCPYIHDI